MGERAGGRVVSFRSSKGPSPPLTPRSTDERPVILRVELLCAPSAALVAIVLTGLYLLTNLIIWAPVAIGIRPIGGSYIGGQDSATQPALRLRARRFECCGRSTRPDMIRSDGGRLYICVCVCV